MTMPKLDMNRWQDFPGTPNRLSGQNDGPYAQLVLGDQEKLAQFGVLLERLPPGSRSSHRHWHETEDEFVFVLSGELVLVEDAETTLRAGDAAAWAAGAPVAHCLENRSSADVVYLEIGDRTPGDEGSYPDDDIRAALVEGAWRFTRKDGTPY